MLLLCVRYDCYESIGTNVVVLLSGCLGGRIVLRGEGVVGGVVVAMRKPLDGYFKPAGEEDEKGEREKVGFHGHCTVECGCCVEYRGCYIPHPRLPSPMTVVCGVELLLGM